MSYKEAKKSWEEILKTTNVTQPNATAVLPEDEKAAEVAKLQKLAEQCRKLAAELEYLAPVPSSGIEAFFDAVGQGVVNAQQTLDDQTAIYLSKKSSFPTAFRIPKASAEIQFSASERKDGGFLARIFTDTTATEKATKHKVTFDIVAAPLPPELAQQPSLPWMSAFVVTDLPTRRSLFKNAKEFHGKIPSGDENKNLKARAFRICEKFNRTVIVQAGDVYAVLLVYRPDKDPTKPDKDPRAVLEILRLGSGVPKLIDNNAAENPEAEKLDIAALYDSLTPFLDEQEARLRKLDELYPP